MNKIPIFSLTLLFALILPLFANAQVTVKGIVTDESGVPLVGVSVRYKEVPQVGVTTDIDGKFSIKEVKEGKTLVFSYIGMKNAERLLKGTTSFIKIQMEAETSELDQVVITGYTQTTFKKMTGSVGIITADQLKDQAQPTVDALMQGKIAGVAVSAVTGQPGSTQKIRIRGTNTVTGDGEPLWVIDGVPMQGSTADMPNSSEIKSGQFDDLFMNGVAGINPSDIESITILKDASATAIYGSRASNGIILVTTKKGKTGKASITFNTNIGIQNLINKQKVLNASQFKEILDAATDNTYLWDKEEQRMFDEGRSTDWQDLITQSGVYQNYNLGITGGSEKTTYYLGLDWVDQEGIIKNTGYQKGNIRFNLDSKLNNWLTMGAKFNVIRSSTNSSNTDGVAGMNSLDQGTMGSAIASKPSAPIFNEDGTYYDNLLLRPNPVAAVTYFKNNFTQTRINASFNLEAEILKNLKLRTENGTEYINNQSNVFQDSRMTGIYKNVNISDRENGEQFYLQTENTLTYQLNKGIHRLTAVGGFSASIFNWTMMSAQVLNASNITQNDNLGTGTPKSINSDKVKSTLASFSPTNIF